jgi:hypothetical protein
MCDVRLIKFIVLDVKDDEMWKDCESQRLVGRNHDNVSDWSDMSTYRLLFQKWASTIIKGCWSRVPQRQGYHKFSEMGITLVKIVIIKLYLDIYKIHIHTTPSFNPTFRSQVFIWKSIWDWRTTPITLVPFNEASGTKIKLILLV